MNAMTLFRTTRNGEFAAAFYTCYKTYCTGVEDVYTPKKKVIHPYRQIHPWKSEKEFANSLLKNIIYNAGRLSFYV